MNKPVNLATFRQTLTSKERDLMEHVVTQVRPVFGGWEAVVYNVDADTEHGHSKVRDSALQAYIDGESLWFAELDARIERRDSEEAETRVIERKSTAECHGRRF